MNRYASWLRKLAEFTIKAVAMALIIVLAFYEKRIVEYEGPEAGE